MDDSQVLSVYGSIQYNNQGTNAGFSKYSNIF